MLINNEKILLLYETQWTNRISNFCQKEKIATFVEDSNLFSKKVCKYLSNSQQKKLRYKIKIQKNKIKKKKKIKKKRK